MAKLTIRVECYSGYRTEEIPHRFFLKDRKVEVVRILDRWLAPDHRYFKVCGDDGAVYVLRNDGEADCWELTMFDSSAEFSSPSRSE